MSEVRDNHNGTEKLWKYHQWQWK